MIRNQRNSTNEILMNPKEMKIRSNMNIVDERDRSFKGNTNDVTH
jgi:hypothetical protein